MFLHSEPSQYSKMVNFKATISFFVVGRVGAFCQNFARGGMRSTKLQKLCSHTLRVACYYYYEYDLPLCPPKKINLQLLRNVPEHPDSYLPKNASTIVSGGRPSSLRGRNGLYLRPLPVLLPPVAHQPFPKQQVAWLVCWGEAMGIRGKAVSTNR